LIATFNGTHHATISLSNFFFTTENQVNNFNHWFNKRRSSNQNFYEAFIDTFVPFTSRSVIPKSFFVNLLTSKSFYFQFLFVKSTFKFQTLMLKFVLHIVKKYYDYLDPVFYPCSTLLSTIECLETYTLFGVNRKACFFYICYVLLCDCNKSFPPFMMKKYSYVLKIIGHPIIF